MRKNYIVKIVFLLFATVTGLVSCRENAAKSSHAGHAKEQLYTCPMHPQIVRNEPGKCPICGMDLVPKDSNKEIIIDSSIVSLSKPVNEQVIASVPAIKAEKGRRIYSMQMNGVVTYDTRKQTSIASRVGGRIERLLIKYNYQPVKKGQLIMEIYSPDLAAAQRELIFISTSSDREEMLLRAKQRLQLLGMRAVEIEQVIKTKTILYKIPVYSNTNGYILEQSAAGSNLASSASSATAMNPSVPSAGDGMGSMSGATSSGSSVPVPQSPISSPVLLREGQYVSAGQTLFTIYQAGNLVAEFALRSQLAAEIKRGQDILFYPGTNQTDMYAGSVGLIEPSFASGQNFTRVRVYFKNRGLQVGQLLTGNLAVIFDKGSWIPKKAVWKLGSRSVVFKKENQVYVPRKVEVGAEAADMIQILTDIGDWEIASNAYYLVDSESFIKSNNQEQ